MLAVKGVLWSPAVGLHRAALGGTGRTLSDACCPLALPCSIPHSGLWGGGRRGRGGGSTQQRTRMVSLFMESLVQPLGSAEPS